MDAKQENTEAVNKWNLDLDKVLKKLYRKKFADSTILGAPAASLTPRPSFIDSAISSSAPSSSSMVRFNFIKLQNVEQGQLILPATRDDSKLSALILLDNGATNSLITNRLARKLQLNPYKIT